jgi:hypothetical protein
LDCVYDLTSDNSVHHSWYNTGDGWQNELAGASPRTSDLNTPPTICANGTGAETIMVVGLSPNAGHIMATDKTGSQAWTGWVDNGAPTKAVLPYKSLSCDYSVNLGHQDMWIIDANGNRYDNYGSDSNWHGWTSPDTNNQGDVGGQACQGQSTTNGLDCTYYQISNHDVHHDWYNTRTGWLTELAGSTLGTSDPNTPPCIAANGTSAQTIFVVGQSPNAGHIFGTDQTGTGTWSIWHDDLQPPGATLPYKSLGCDYSATLGHQDIWVVDSRGIRYDNYGSDNGGWHGWTADPLPVQPVVKGLDDPGFSHGYDNAYSLASKWLNGSGKAGCPTSTTCASFSAVTMMSTWAVMEPCKPTDITCSVVDKNGNPAVKENAGWFDFGNIDSFINLNGPSGAQLKLRIFAGFHAPQWLKDREGTVTEWESGKPDDVVKFWTSGSMTAYQTLVNALAAHYNGTFNDVTVSGCMSVFAEPLMRGLGDARNVTNYWDNGNGLTFIKDQTCQTNAINAHKAFTLTNSSFSFNPWETIVNGGYVQDETATENLMGTGRNTLGSRFVLENNSIRKSFTSYSCPYNGENTYNLMYCKIASLGAPIFMQTAGSNDLCAAGSPATATTDCLDKTLMWAQNLFGPRLGVEIPDNYSAECSANPSIEGGDFCPTDSDSDGLVSWNETLNGF